MTHLGYYSHEFGHLMGQHHTITSHHHSLMHSGHKAGTRLANRPASMNPWFLYKSGWANLSYINSNLNNVNLTYDKSLPGAIQGMSGGLLIWNILNNGLNSGETDLIEADDTRQEVMASMATDMFRPSVYTSGIISDETTPADLRRRNSSSSKFAITDFNSTGSTIQVNFKIDYELQDAPAILAISNAG